MKNQQYYIYGLLDFIQIINHVTTPEQENDQFWENSVNDSK